MNENQGFTTLETLVSLILVAALAGGIYYFKDSIVSKYKDFRGDKSGNQVSINTESTPTPTATPTATPTTSPSPTATAEGTGTGTTGTGTGMGTSTTGGSLSFAGESLPTSGPESSLALVGFTIGGSAACVNYFRSKRHYQARLKRIDIM